MKKLQVIAFAAPLFAISITLKAQTSNETYPASYRTIDPVATARHSSKVVATENKALTKAIGYFNANFKNGLNVKWFGDGNMIMASFIKNGINNQVVYNKRGIWLRTMKGYRENHMPRDIRELVKRSEYYDDKIVYIQEILDGDMLFYIVHLENESVWKQVLVHDGEISLYEEYKKQQ